MPSTIAERLAGNVRRLMARQSPPWNQEELSRQLGCGSGNVVRLLAGIHAPGAATIEKIAETFAVDPVELLRPLRK